MDEPYYAGGFLYHAPTRHVLLHHRGVDAPSDPDRWDIFGGRSEEEDGRNPIATWHRELCEELGVDLRGIRAIPICDYVNSYGRHRYVFYSVWPDLRTDFVLGEGQGFAWYLLDESLALYLTEMTRHDLEVFRAQLQHPTTG